ncbi:MAG: PIG-L deacetylase family protein [Burkholderiales bacterium]
MENWFVPDTPAPLPDVDHVLVLAPHADDEILGCGGLLARLAQRGSHITVLLLTDSGGYFSGQDRLDYARLRFEESKAAAAIIGIKGLRALDIYDRHLGHTPKALMEIVRAIQEAQPALLLAPGPSEIHPDHSAAARLALTALDWLAQHALPIPEFWQYEVGQPLQPNCLIDITPVVEIKKQAMQCFPSQIKQQDYVQHILALNTYRTYSLPMHLGVRWAEAYRRFTATEVQHLLQYQGSPHHLGLLSRMSQALDVAQAQSETQSAHWHELISVSLPSKLSELTQTISLWEERRSDHQNKLLTEQANITRQWLEAASSWAQQMTGHQALIDQFEKLHRHLLEEHHKILNSKSWRLTAPLRWLENWWSQLRKRRGD